MALSEGLVKGDWVRVSQDETAIEGQVVNDVPIGGPALLTIMVSKEGHTWNVNVNFWDIDMVRRNYLGRRANDRN